MKAIDLLLAVAAVSLLGATPPTPSAVPKKPGLSRPVNASGTVVVPERFLRRWDPVTIFFAGSPGPEGGGPEDAPQKHVVMSPAHPGAFTWIDGRTLQFQPAEPWPPLARFQFSVGGKISPLATLMAAPIDTLPSREATGLDPVEEIKLTFPEPMDVESLARMTTIELRQLPGVGGAASRWLDRDDFQVKAVQRTSRADSATYVLALARPIPFGTRAIVHLRLSLDDATITSGARASVGGKPTDDAPESMVEIPFSTDEPFRVQQVGCGGNRVPITPEGTRYTKDQALKCVAGVLQVEVAFSATPRKLGPVEARNLVQIAPAVENMKFDVRGSSLVMSGRFQPETAYRVTLSPIPLTDDKGRSLQMSGRSEAWLWFPRQPAYLTWQKSQGVVERYGPQLIPMQGRGQDRIDLRIYPVNALDRSFWPFPSKGVSVDESQRPAGPGEEPVPYVEVDRHVSGAELTEHLRNLPAPPVSVIERLPLKREGSGASFGLDLAEHFAKLSAKGAPGHYLVGVRLLNGSNARAWLRVQVTDLSLTAVEEPFATRFMATSLQTGEPVAGASIRIEGGLSQSNGTRVWTTLGSGTTDESGTWVMPAPGYQPDTSKSVRRIVVSKGDDHLVLDPTQPPETYSDNQWFASSDTWLQWMFGHLDGRTAPEPTLAHIFTERPLYRPDEEVHVKGWLRTRRNGTLELSGIGNGTLVVDGPGDLTWNYPVTLGPAGGFYHRFKEEDLPTGDYAAWFEDPKGQRYGIVRFKVEAYRLPEFEIKLTGPDRAPLDREFEVGMVASYYAGGRVADRPVRWRVTQFPYTWVPSSREGFLFSSDGRFSNRGDFESTGTLEREETTDEQGSSKVVVNPAIEPTSAPRTYVVEATVTGADDQTVTSTRSVIALPPFVLGLSVPRFLEKTKKIEPKVIVVGTDGKNVAGQKVTVRLLHRQWHSHLAASDFSDGVAKYVTDVVDDKIGEKTVTSTEGVLAVPFDLPRAGVYVVELESRDRLGRTQTVAVDLFAAGDEPITWSRPTSQVFAVATDKTSYDPGDEAKVVLKSPFQKGSALAIVESPEGNRYSWVEVKGGTAVFSLPVKGTWVPRVPVHFVLMRGRLAGTAPVPGTDTDLGKPTTMAATAWLTVNPIDNQVVVTLDYPERAQPGDKVKVTVKLSAPKTGKPLPGEVTLWLVDQAVLALGQEQRLDPLPDFITPVSSRIAVRDTRNDVVGWLPLAENPGGDEGAEEESILDKVTVRKNFKTVPYYEPAIKVGADGTATVTVQLPDNLTNFKLRAKAASGPARFGVGVGQIAVRLPLIVQPALPRFVRPGDTFAAAAIGRVVEGKGGPGAAEIRVDGMKTTGGSLKQKLEWVENRPQRIEVPVEVLTPGYDKDGALARTEVKLTVGVSRAGDGAKDAFEVSLPIRDDRSPVRVRALADLKPGVAFDLEALPEAARPGTVKRELLVSDQPGLVKMAAGLDFLLAYPHGCTEQRLSKARAQIAMKKFRGLMHQGGNDARLKRDVQQTLEWIPSVVDPNGLCGYWPGSRGYVSLTAWVVQFMVEAKEAGFAVDQKQMDVLTRSLEQALRSDYSRFIDGEAWEERAWALAALSAAGKYQPGYADELARQAQYLDLEGSSEVLLAYSRAGQGSAAPATVLQKKLTDGVVFRLFQGKEIYGGLQKRASERNALILPGETRTVAEMTRALYKAKSGHPRLQLLTDALVTLGRDDGWGSTNADAAALLALSEVLSPPFKGASPHSVDVTFGGVKQTVKTGPDAPVGYLLGTDPGKGQVTLAAGGGAAPVVLRVETTYVPSADGSMVTPTSNGFVVSRDLRKVLAGGQPAEKTAIEKAGTRIAYGVADVIEDHVQVVNPKDRAYVAIVIPLAAGMEPLNPNLATAPPEATPSKQVTLAPSYVAFLDDSVTYYYDFLPSGTYDFHFRTRAQIAGSFIQPAARAEMMYDLATRGSSAGAKIDITAKEQAPK